MKKNWIKRILKKIKDRGGKITKKKLMIRKKIKDQILIQ
jgi:hypothetical protein